MLQSVNIHERLVVSCAIQFVLVAFDLHLHVIAIAVRIHNIKIQSTCTRLHIRLDDALVFDDTHLHRVDSETSLDQLGTEVGPILEYAAKYESHADLRSIPPCGNRFLHLCLYHGNLPSVRRPDGARDAHDTPRSLHEFPR